MNKNRCEYYKIIVLQGIADLFSLEREAIKDKKSYSSCDIKEGYYNYLRIVCKDDMVQYFLQASIWERKPDFVIEIKGIGDMSKSDFSFICSDISSEFKTFFLDETNSSLFAYKLKMVLELEGDDYSLHENIFIFEDAERKNKLKKRMQDYIQKVIYEKSRPMKDEREIIAFCDNIFNFDLMGYDELKLIEILDKSFENINFFEEKRLEEYFLNNLLTLLKNWTQKEFFPLYCEVDEKNSKKYILKNGIKKEDIDLKKLELYVYQAICKIKYEGHSIEKSLGKKDLERARREFGSKKADQYLEDGTGRFDLAMIKLEDMDLKCSANDIFSVINISIFNESEKAYSKALDFIINLLKSGFPHSYHIKFNSQLEKRFLPVKGLAKTQTHRFFAQALEYENLYDKLELYVRTAMERHAWYEDIEESEKSCMPGSYAVFGLALKKEKYFPLLIQYFSMLDYENQTVHQYFLNAFIDNKSEVNQKKLSVICKGLLSARFDIKFENLAKLMENKENKQLLIKELTDKNRYEQESILYGIWGNDWQKHVSGF